MRTAVTDTSIDAFHAHRTQSAAQRNRILTFIRERGGDWSIGELADHFGMQKSTVSARIWECLNETFELVERPRRKDRISRITIRPVGLPMAGQWELFQ